MYRSFITLVAVIVATTAVGAVTALASRSAVPSFELTEDSFSGGKFTASGAFCPSGRVEGYEIQLLTCADGSGTAMAVVVFPGGVRGGDSGTWKIIGGTGAYEKLRGQGMVTTVETGEFLDDCWDYCPVFDISWTGVADLDDVAPALRIVSAQASKLRPAGAYSLELALELGDEFEASPVPYVLRVTTGVRTLAWISGTAETPNLELTVPIRPGKRALSVRVHLAASDPLGNESSVRSPMIVLPR
jgi:hypothetical protein